MSLYSEYILEREGFQALEYSWGFITYKIQGNECYARDIYVHPDARSYANARRLIEQVRRIAKSRGCKCLLGTIDPELKGSARSYKLMQYYGFKLHKEVPGLLVLKKEI